MILYTICSNSLSLMFAIFLGNNMAGREMIGDFYVERMNGHIEIDGDMYKYNICIQYRPDASDEAYKHLDKLLSYLTKKISLTGLQQVEDYIHDEDFHVYVKLLKVDVSYNVSTGEGLSVSSR